MQLEFSSRAKRDLDEILSYLVQAGGNDVARRVGRRIREKCEEIRPAPGMGKRQPHRPEIRKIIVGPHKIFYRIESERVII